MISNNISRRDFCVNSAIAGGALVAGANLVSAAQEQKLHLASNQYSWTVYFRREGRDFNQNLNAGLEAVSESGLDGLEPLVTSVPQLKQLTMLLGKHGLEMRSIYVNSTLHEPEQADKSIDEILSIAEEAKKVETKIIVTNPNPIQWGSGKNKSDQQLITQANALNKLGERLVDMDLTLAYHNHDAELRQGAREFHHMMVGTDPDLVSLCLDSHWIYRGTGNSSVALFDIVLLYASRIRELHLRQSIDGVWSETFGEGDIDYVKLVQLLVTEGVKPHLVLEQAVEKGTPNTMNTVEAHERSSAYARKMFEVLK